MFSKHLSDMATSPSAYVRFARYIKRLEKETHWRGMGLLLILIAAGLIFYTFITGSEPSLQYSDSYLANGIATKNDLLSQYDRPDSDLPAIYGKLGVSRQDISNLSQSPNEAIVASSANNFWFVNRSTLHTTPADAKKTVTVVTDGPSVYFRPLVNWNITQKTTVYKAFKGRSSTTGQTGNLISGKVNKKASLQTAVTTRPAKNELMAGVTYDLLVEYRNLTADSLAENITVTFSPAPTIYKLTTPSELIETPEGKLSQEIGTAAYSKDSYSTIYKITMVSSSNINEVCKFIEIKSPSATILPQRCGSTLPETTSNLPSISSSAALINGNNKTPINSRQQLKGGEQIQFSLSTYNSSSTPISNYEMRTYIGDLLDYSKLQEQLVKINGGEYNTKTKEIFWKNLTIPPGEEITRIYTIDLKNTVPSTNQATLSMAYDCRMSHKYGNTTEIELLCPAIKQTEKWPSLTGFAALLFFGGIIFISGVFYLRSRIFLTEAKLIKRAHQTGHRNK